MDGNGCRSFLDGWRSGSRFRHWRGSRFRHWRGSRFRHWRWSHGSGRSAWHAEKPAERFELGGVDDGASASSAGILGHDACGAVEHDRSSADTDKGSRPPDAARRHRRAQQAA